MKSSLFGPYLQKYNVSPQLIEYLDVLLGLLLVFFAASLATMIVRRTLLQYLTRWIQGNNYRWDDPLAANNFLSKISWFVPVTIYYLSIDLFIQPGADLYLPVKRLVSGGFVIVSVLSVTALLSAITDIHRIVRKKKGSSLRGYTDAAKILTYIFGAIFLLSIFTGKSPWGIFSILGGLTAVTMLVFKDSILGFVASVQINSTDLIRIGDWVEVPQYGVDGDVIDMSIHAIRVQNWDKTISTVPPYALVSSSFKNWRGMSESAGRRIKRALNIDIHSIRFCDEAMLTRFSRIPLLVDYLERKEHEIGAYNQHQLGSEKGSAAKEPLLGGRQQTNIGIFRAYIIAYLKNNPNIHGTKMTFLVRQLAPGDNGLPLEIYVFSKDKEWANYEAIQADIFDHLLAAAPEFGLRIFQSPSGYDFRTIGVQETGNS